jgi:two-component system sensor histidine kinase KdpD
LNYWLQHWIGYQAIALVYLLAVVLLARFVGRGPIVFGTSLTALGWNFLFCPPRYSFHISGSYDKMMLVTYFAVALTIGQLTARLRAEGQVERQREKISTALYHLAQAVAETEDRSQFLSLVAKEANALFNAQVAFLLPAPGASRQLVSERKLEWYQNESERNAALWAFEQNRPAGHGTDVPLGAAGLYLPLSIGAAPTGVMVSKLDPKAKGTGQILHQQQSFARQIALLLDRQRLRQAEAQARRLAESERLGRTLLNSVSHELRTPIAAIASATTAIQTVGPLEPTQQLLAGEIDVATARLNRVVQSLLSAARLQSGLVRPRFDWCDVRELVRVTVRNLGTLLSNHPVQIQVPAGLPLLKADLVLMEQALANLLINGALHTPKGTQLEILGGVKENEFCLEVADQGPGLPPDQLDHLFDAFQRGPEARPGGAGLGLAIVRGFIEAQGGRVLASNRIGGGALFTIYLPLTEQPQLPQET